MTSLKRSMALCSTIACLCAFAFWASVLPAELTVARADFVDELPDLPLTPAPLPSATPEGAAPGATKKGTRPNTGNGQSTSGPKGSTAPGGSGAVSGAGQGAAPGTPSTQGEPRGLFGSDSVKHDTNAPISTSGDVLEGSLNKGKMTLTGNVEIRQDDTLMKSDVAEVFSKPGTTTPERALAKGRVSIFKRPSPRVPEIRAVADELEYFVDERKVVLKGKPKIWRGKELLQGEIIELALDTGDIRIRSARSVVDPSSQQDPKSPGRGSGSKK